MYLQYNNWFRRAARRIKNIKWPFMLRSTGKRELDLEKAHLRGRKALQDEQVRKQMEIAAEAIKNIRVMRSWPPGRSEREFYIQVAIGEPEMLYLMSGQHDHEFKEFIADTVAHRVRGEILRSKILETPPQEANRPKFGFVNTELPRG